MAQLDETSGPHLPAVPETDVEEIVDGEIVDEAEAPAPARPVVVNVVQVLNVVVKHEHTRAAGRHALYVVAGVVVAWRRWNRRRTLATEMAQQARMQGDNVSIHGVSGLGIS